MLPVRGKRQSASVLFDRRDPRRSSCGTPWFHLDLLDDSAVGLQQHRQGETQEHGARLHEIPEHLPVGVENFARLRSAAMSCVSRARVRHCISR